MRTRCLACCLLMLLWQTPTLAGATPELIWYATNYPPAYIVNGPLKGQGFADKRDAFIARALADYHLTPSVANTARLFDEMKRRDNVCNGSLLKTPEREKFAIFSEPVVELVPAGLVTLKLRKGEFAPYLNARGELRLDELIQSGKFKVGVAAERSYGELIDSQLLPGRATAAVQPFFASDIFSSGLLKMSREKSIDAVMGYPVELSWGTQQFKLDPEEFWFIGVEGETELFPSRVGCSRSETGKAVITRVNELLSSGGLKELGERSYLEWLPPEHHSVYRRLHKTPAPAGK